ncbi:GTP pyrophosphokinase family protein [Vagococcus coleopterorum]|uniref:GTP pyrophosphokinase family protein n=1 Tax=Vagococcus coleopterorum TaxID=2714946 RepID=A0A6G8AL91_9ENTE|nr:GTP pyrophosphokinase family protein [Vagococcus coleopterorum]QIL45729.1 GTP pyrophosphokinase family protein [Vagococcus coleopterorum]
MEKWELFLAPYEQVVTEMKIKLKGIRKQFTDKNEHSPIEFVTGRVKPIDSIKTKSRLKGIPLDNLEEEMQDIAGLRVTCQFVEDIYEVVNLIKSRNDLTVIQDRDYLSHEKESGYRSYHLIIEYPIQLVTGEKKLYAEIQIRTLAMNFWATIEHSLNYKYQGEFPEEINKRLIRASEAANLLDEEMSKIREEIQEAQQLFSHGRGKQQDRYYQDFIGQKETELGEED